MRTKVYISIQLLNILFSFASVFVKYASLSMEMNGFFAIPTFINIFIYIALLAAYAFFWQKIMKVVPLSTAYMSKGLVVFWALLWAVLFFGDAITLNNIIGVVVIFAGTLLVNADE